MEQKDLSKFLLTSVFQIVSRNRDNNNKIAEQSDRIIVWLVGFSIAIIALLLSKGDLLIPLTKNSIEIFILIYLVTIVFGILYRIASFLAQLMENRLFMNFESYLYGLLHGPKLDSPRQIEDKDSYYDIIGYFKEDFQMEFKDLPLDNLTPQLEYTFKLITADFYNKLSGAFKKALNEEIEKVAQILKYQFGFSEKKLDQLRNRIDTNRNYKKFVWPTLSASHILFLLTIFSFLMGIVLFIIKILEFKICS
ncbi:MAG: hypothetical protein NTX61_07640 [Bacteroidetes bacterium]|nr:hypothetical protein [Bacteroidota bacterium]